MLNQFKNWPFPLHHLVQKHATLVCSRQGTHRKLYSQLSNKCSVHFTVKISPKAVKHAQIVLSRIRLPAKMTGILLKNCAWKAICSALGRF